MGRLRTAQEFLDNIVITIDGPSGSGKSTTARGAARQLGLRHLDTGAMYRTVTLLAMEQGVELSDAAAMGAVADACNIAFDARDDGDRVSVAGRDVTDAIRSAEVTERVSIVSAHRQVRRAMVRLQRRIANEGGVVLEGRDTGSVVVPTANVKIYLEASVDVRAARRAAEYEDRGTPQSIESVRNNLIDRDEKDSSREISPLKRPVGALVVDTGATTVDGQIEQVVACARLQCDQLAALAATGRTYRRRTPHMAIAQTIIYLLMLLVWGARIRRQRRFAFKENYIFASNHRSNIDPPFVGTSTFRSIFFVAKVSLFKNPLFGWLIRSFNAFPIRRHRFDRDAMKESLEILEQGNFLVMFPEGGRQPGPALGPSRPGIGYIALHSGRPVIPIYVDGTARLRSTLFRKPHLAIIHGEPIRLTDPDLSKWQNPDCYREYGDMVMQAIQALQDQYDSGSR